MSNEDLRGTPRSQHFAPLIDGPHFNSFHPFPRARSSFISSWSTHQRMLCSLGSRAQAGPEGFGHSRRFLFFSFLSNAFLHLASALSYQKRSRIRRLILLRRFLNRIWFSLTAILVHYILHLAVQDARTPRLCSQRETKMIWGVMTTYSLQICFHR